MVRLLNRCACFLIVAAASTLCDGMAAGEDNTAADEGVTCEDPRELPDKTRLTLEREALDGSESAAFRVSAHYISTQEGSAEVRFWLTVAAENGSQAAQYVLGRALVLDQDSRLQARARFWLRRAVDGKETSSTPEGTDAF